jgi:DNA (cytosine-5)-methyltransferase 1
MQQSPTRTAALFAGIGGIEAGLHRAGVATDLLCEIEPGAVGVLEEQFAGTRVHRDVTTLSARAIAGADLLTAGFPCQDLSQAGRTKGMGGDQSSLVRHVFRLLERRRVPWVLLENVPFMLQLGRGHALDAVVSELERLRYRWAYRVIDSRAFGLPQRRERVYLLAARNDDPRTVLFAGNEQPEPPDLPPPHERSHGFYWTEGGRGLGWAVDAVPTLKGGSTIGIASPPAIWLPTGEIVQPDIRDAERMQGFPADWTAPAEATTKRSHRWKLVGNAVTVDVAAWIGEQFRTRDGRTDITGEPVRPDRSWPRVAWNVGQGRRTTKAIGSWPVARRGEPLARFLAYPTRPLSERATSGFLKRFRASSLTKPDGFLDALEAHLARVSASVRVADDGGAPDVPPMALGSRHRSRTDERRPAAVAGA